LGTRHPQGEAVAQHTSGLEIVQASAHLVRVRIKARVRVRVGVGVRVKALLHVEIAQASVRL
jgi:hypothetical protein